MAPRQITCFNTVHGYQDLDVKGETWPKVPRSSREVVSHAQKGGTLECGVQNNELDRA